MRTILAMVALSWAFLLLRLAEPPAQKSGPGLEALLLTARQK